MTSPQPALEDPTTQPENTTEAETVALIAGLLAAAGAAGATYAAGEAAYAGIATALRGLGLTAVQARRLLASDAARPAPPIIPLSPTTRDVFHDGPTHRARYLVAAAKRIVKATGASAAAAVGAHTPHPGAIAKAAAAAAKAAEHGAPGKAAKAAAGEAEVSSLTPLVKALAKEKTYFTQHLSAQAKRQQAAQAIDAQINAHGNLLGWYAVLDERTTPECRAAHGRNFYADHPPAIGLPGLKHAGNCRCHAGAPHAGASLVGDAAPRHPGPPAPASPAPMPEAIAAAQEVTPDVSIEPATAPDGSAVELSAKTAYYATHHHELGTPGGPGLWRHKGWQLPDYITNIAKGIMESGVVDKSRAIAIAVGKVRDWAEGKGNVSPEVRAAAVKAIAEWEALRARAAASRATTLSSDADAVELAAVNGHHVAGTAYHWWHGWHPRDVATALLHGKKKAAEALHKSGTGHFNAEPSWWWKQNPHLKKTLAVGRRGGITPANKLEQLPSKKVKGEPGKVELPKGASALAKTAHAAPDILPSQKNTMSVQAHALQKAVKTGTTQFVSQPGGPNSHLVVSETKPSTLGKHLEFTPKGQVYAHYPNGNKDKLAQPYLKSELGPHFAGPQVSTKAAEKAAPKPEAPKIPEAPKVTPAAELPKATPIPGKRSKKGALVVQAPAGTHQVGDQLQVTSPAGNVHTVEVTGVGKEFNVKGVPHQYHYVKGVKPAEAPKVRPEEPAAPKVDAPKVEAPSAPEARKVGAPSVPEPPAAPTPEVVKPGTPPVKAATGLGPTHKALYNAPDLQPNGNTGQDQVIAMQKAIKTGKPQYWSAAGGYSDVKPAVTDNGAYLAYAVFHPDGTVEKITSAGAHVPPHKTKIKSVVSQAFEVSGLDSKGNPLDGHKTDVPNVDAPNMHAPKPAKAERAALPEPAVATHAVPLTRQAPAKGPLTAEQRFTPVDATGWTQVGGQKGSNLGGTYTDPAGNEFYVKVSQSDKHARNEALAAHLYQLAGVGHSDLRLAKVGDGKLGTASPILPGAKNDLKAKLADPAYKAKVQDGFATDVWLANWDVVGLGHDNIVSDKDGNPVRIDPGGALLFRAKGEKKGGAFTSTADEWDTLRNVSKNPQAASVFAGMTDEQLKASAQKVVDISPAQIDAAVKASGFSPMDQQLLATRLKERRADIAKRAGIPLPEEHKAEAPKPAKPETMDQATAELLAKSKAKSGQPHYVVQHADGQFSVEKTKPTDGKAWEEHLPNGGVGASSADRSSTAAPKVGAMSEATGGTPLVNEQGTKPGASQVTSLSNMGKNGPAYLVATRDTPSGFTITKDKPAPGVAHYVGNSDGSVHSVDSAGNTNVVKDATQAGSAPKATAPAAPKATTSAPEVAPAPGMEKWVAAAKDAPAIDPKSEYGAVPAALQKAVKTGKPQYADAVNGTVTTAPPTSVSVKVNPDGSMQWSYPGQPTDGTPLVPEMAASMLKNKLTPAETPDALGGLNPQLEASKKLAEQAKAAKKLVVGKSSPAGKKQAAALQQAALTGQTHYLPGGGHASYQMPTTEKPSVHHIEFQPNGTVISHGQNGAQVLQARNVAKLTGHFTPKGVKSAAKPKLAEPPVKADTGLGPTTKALYNAPDIEVPADTGYSVQLGLAKAKALQMAVKTGKPHYLPPGSAQPAEISTDKPNTGSFFVFNPDGTTGIGYQHGAVSKFAPSKSKATALLGLNHVGAAPAPAPSTAKLDMPKSGGNYMPTTLSPGTSQNILPSTVSGPGAKPIGRFSGAKIETVNGVPHGDDKAFASTVAGDYLTDHQPPLPTVATVAEHYKAHAVKLTSAEKAAADAYTGNWGYGAHSINEKLRRGDALSSSDKKRVAELDSAMQKYALPGMTYLKRGFTPKPGSFPEENLTGKVYQQAGFVSTSVGDYGGFSGSVRMRILAPKGTHGLSTSGANTGVASEGEFILPRGTQFLVQKDVTVNGTRYITAVVVPAPSKETVGQHGVIADAERKLKPGAYSKEGLYYLKTHGRAAWLRMYGKGAPGAGRGTLATGSPSRAPVLAGAGAG